ncbi:unnamed protein product [Echinostoma caproni]|uniref:BMERB domain-containing protein n=1 Tax=Echinostoma caproni TaxID=27848 RepID=A0A183BGJ2_9TREM|nr:unnamed protein product [Echinostoma caproni]
MKKLEIRQKQLDLEIATLDDEEHSLGGDDDYGDEIMKRLELVKDYVNLLPADRPLPNTTMSSNKTTHCKRTSRIESGEFRRHSKETLEIFEQF